MLAVGCLCCVVMLGVVPQVGGQLTTPEQVHLAVGFHPSEMTVMWVTQSYAPSMVEYWLDTAPSSVLWETGEADTFEVPVSWEVMNNSGRGIQDFIRADTSRTMHAEPRPTDHVQLSCGQQQHWMELGVRIRIPAPRCGDEGGARTNWLAGRFWCH